MTRHVPLALLATALGALVLQTRAMALSVTQPTAATVVAAGDDYATAILGNAWDMNDSSDIDRQESQLVANQTFSGGIFSGDTTGNGAYVYPLFMGYAASIDLDRGFNFPIDTTHYRFLTIKLRATQPAGTTQFMRAVFLENDSSSYSDNTFGFTGYLTLAASQWTIFKIDMNTQADATSPHHWTDFPRVRGLRIDPATTGTAGPYASVHFDVDWIRLTAPVAPAQLTTVQWTDSGYSGTYDIAAVDAAGTGTAFTLGTGVSGTSLQADLSLLAPGQYQIRVTRTVGGTAANSATFRINAPPQIALTSPSAAGDLSKEFGATVVGNPWGPIDAGDFVPGIGVRNFVNVSYSTPAGSFYGRPTNSDPGWFFNLAGHTFDAGLYRSLCFNLEVLGPRGVGAGSVARVFWGPSTSSLTTSLPITLDDNAGDTVVSRYCIADMAAYAPDPTAPANGGAWSGIKGALRLDPDEFTPPSGCNTADTCHDVRLDAVTLSPFASANPGYTFTWSLNDADNASTTLQLALDPDTTPGNGNEHVIYNQAAANGSGSFGWTGTPSVPSGTYHVLATVSDGINTVNQYAGGVIVVTSDIIFQDGFE